LSISVSVAIEEHFPNRKDNHFPYTNLKKSYPKFATGLKNPEITSPLASTPPP
jgi:hypothetical protein